MNAEPLLGEVARCLHEMKLEAVLIGNAAAALQGAPVTTVNFDFLFRKTPRKMVKSKRAARRPRDLAVLHVLEASREEASKPPGSPRGRRARE